MRYFIFMICFLAISSIITAGSITVVGDINATSNNQFYLNVLGTSKNVLFGRNSSGAGVGPIYTLYSGQSGVTVNSSNTTITSSILSSYSLLVFNHASSWNTVLSYTSDELVAIGNFLQSGGNMLLVAESNSTDVYNNFNTFLSSIGSTIQYTGSRHSVGLSSVIMPHALTTGVSSFSASAYNSFSGGTVLVKDVSGNHVVVTDLIGNTYVPEASSVFLYSFAVLFCMFLKQNRK